VHESLSATLGIIQLLQRALTFQVLPDQFLADRSFRAQVRACREPKSRKPRGSVILDNRRDRLDGETRHVTRFASNRTGNAEESPGSRPFSMLSIPPRRLSPPASLASPRRAVARRPCRCTGRATFSSPGGARRDQSFIASASTLVSMSLASSARPRGGRLSWAASHFSSSTITSSRSAGMAAM
jgi:hypothetical protein